jgi:hypothetical protein
MTYTINTTNIPTEIHFLIETAYVTVDEDFIITNVSSI